jgi:hypothetical protein
MDQLFTLTLELRMCKRLENWWSFISYNANSQIAPKETHSGDMQSL